jgi:hypothetical protein
MGNKRRHSVPKRGIRCALLGSAWLVILCSSCAPRILDVNPREGKPATTVNVAMEYLTYSLLETTAYVAFPPVWPFVFRSNHTQFKLRVLPPE